MYSNASQFDGGGEAAAPEKIKVSQATVDAVKDDGRGNMGQAAANKSAYGAPGYNGSTFSPNAPVSKEYKEATKRVYPNAKAKSPASSSGATNPKQPGPAKPKAGTTSAKIKVSQATVDQVKKAGKSAAIATAKKGTTAYTGSSMQTTPASAEYKEAVRRIYQSPAKSKPKSAGGGGGSKGKVVL